LLISLAHHFYFPLRAGDAAPNVPSNVASLSRARRFSILFSKRLRRFHFQSFASPLALKPPARKSAVAES
jgi:hypothetical protein